MTRGRLKSLGTDPGGERSETMPYDPDALKSIVAAGKLV
jgi:hypothetical protein